MISNVYSYYLAQYGNKTDAKHDVHKKNDIKNIYNKMLKINRFTPFYKVDVSESAQKYAIDLKEHARQLTNIAYDLSDDESNTIAYKKSAISSDDNVVEVEYIGNANQSSVDSFEINILQVASAQVNTGHYLNPSSKHLSEGSYSFDLTVADLTYEFEFGVSKTDTTKDVQEKISRLINRSNIGVKSFIRTDSLGNTAISIESESMGIPNMQSSIFSISDNDAIENKINNAVDLLGLDRITRRPSNAVYSINGDERISSSNQLFVNQSFKLNLKQETKNAPVKIGIEGDDEAIVDSIENLVSGYNNLISVASDYNNKNHNNNMKLHKEFISIARIYNETLKENGLELEVDGSITINKALINKAAENSSLSKIYSNLDSFKSTIQNKAEDISLNPMNYVNNKIVAYKHPFKSLNDPYNTSAYSGMMFDGYL